MTEEKVTTKQIMPKGPNTIMKEFDKAFAPDLVHQIRLNTVSGTVSQELEGLIAERFPLAVFNKTGEQTTNFHLSNGKVIKI